MIQQFSFDGSGRQIDAKGVFFRYESGTDGSGVVDIRLTIDGQNVGTFSPGDALDLPAPARRWEVVPVSAGCVGVVKIGNARVTSPKLQGVVQTVDGGRARSVGATAFMGCAYSTAAASNLTYVQLYNKPSSDRMLVVNALTCLATNQMGFHLRSNAAALATLQAAGPSKRFGASASAVAELRTAYSPTMGDFGSSGLRLFGGATGGITSVIRFSEPIIVPPGSGLVCHTTTSVDLGVTFEWFEE